MKEHKKLGQKLLSKVTLHFVWGHLPKKQTVSHALQFWKELWFQALPSGSVLVVESANVKAEKPRRRNYEKLMKEANTKNQRYLLAYEKHILKNGTPQEMEELKKLKKEKKRKYAPRKLTQEQRDGLVTDSILSVNLPSISYLLCGQFRAPFILRLFPILLVVTEKA